MLEINSDYIEKAKTLTEKNDKFYNNYLEKKKISYEEFKYKIANINFLLFLKTIPKIGAKTAINLGYKLTLLKVDIKALYLGLLEEDDVTLNLLKDLLNESQYLSIKETVSKNNKIFFLENLEIILSFMFGISIDEFKECVKNRKLFKILVSGDIYNILPYFPLNFSEIDRLKEIYNEDYNKLSEERLKGGLFSVLKEEELINKSLYLSRKILIERTINLLSLKENEGRIKKVLAEEIECGNLIESFYDKSVLYLFENFNIAEGSARELNKRLSVRNNFKYSLKTINKAITEEESTSKISFTEKQKEAIIEAIKENVLIITGGPGTGKTITVNGIINVFHRLNKDLPFTLLSPTGKAARRMEEVSKRKAYTIHRRLGINKDSKETRLRFIESDVIIVDEMSMVDSELFYKLIKNIKNTAKIIFVGDYNQLPSVGPGLVLKDLIESKKLKIIKLSTVKRQGKDSNIVKASEKINNGGLFSGSENYTDYKEINEIDELKTIKTIEEVYKSLLNEGYEEDDILILSPRKDGILGENNLNRCIQELLGKNKSDFVQIDSGKMYKEDRVIMLKNNYKLDIMNGETGVYLGKKAGFYIFNFNNTEVRMTDEDLENVGLSYAITVHKSQGDEYKAVIFAINNRDYSVTNKNVIYTAMTRAKERLFLIGDFKYLNERLHKNNVRERFTGIKEELKNIS